MRLPPVEHTNAERAMVEAAEKRMNAKKKLACLSRGVVRCDVSRDMTRLAPAANAATWHRSLARAFDRRRGRDTSRVQLRCGRRWRTLTCACVVFASTRGVSQEEEREEAQTRRPNPRSLEVLIGAAQGLPYQKEFKMGQHQDG